MPHMVKADYSNKFTIVVAAASLWSLGVIIVDPPPLLDTLLLLGLCYLVTDLLSGLLHVILDNPRSLDIPPIRGLAQGFQRHHSNPDNIFKMALYEHLYVMHLPLTALFVVIAVFHDPRLYVVFLGMNAMLHLMQMAHRWAHVDPATLPAGILPLQRVRILLSKSIHDRHHVDPYDRDFCIMTGMFNRPLNGLTRIFGRTSHWWNAVFLVACFIPVATALLMG